MSPTEAELDKAAHQLAICLMRLCEALECRDAAANYSPLPDPKFDWASPRVWRLNHLRKEYRDWFRRHA